MNEAKQEVYVTEIAKLFPPQGKWTEEDYFALPQTNHIVELSDGELIMPSPATDAHQSASLRLTMALTPFVDEHDLGIVRYSPMSVRLWEGKIREPDVLFFRKEHRDRLGKSVHGVPDWIAEIISRSTKKTDEINKLAEYAQAGVSEYWLLHYKRKTILVYVLPEGASEYTLAATYGAGEIARSETLIGFEVAVDKIFA
jgi:Uma2 family endonuclease